jgi:putative holliday junction resolvase
MTVNRSVLLGLDIGERRIGVASADSVGRLAAPLSTLAVDGTELVKLQRLMLEQGATELVVGLPRNMSGEQTEQTKAVKWFVLRRLQGFELPIHYQDESLTSVQAEDYLKQHKKSYSKADIDALAATLILQDYLEVNHGY